MAVVMGARLGEGGSQVPWLMPIILASWEAGMGDHGFKSAQAKKKKKKFARLPLNGKRFDVVASTSHPRDSRKLKIGGSQFRPA
jgi:hypothetical protein